MKTWYENKMAFHYKQWELAQDSGKEKAANHHMQAYLNYKEMCDLIN